ncbi:hypothetical protein [Acanthopleuribacter pedis]|uniref:Alginate export domain-containing protein n=1 Tax=Acanthopleuribacter pedis TaxID=442870 RepID=A0A8J7QED2_9BACT|nr:hypothetical protein [Acanthopleuribacter pedis]MBO1322354.1 hypothetical protein [Acanthopleuribacter pedis]
MAFVRFSSMILVCFGLLAPLLAQSGGTFTLETRANYRDSDELSLPIAFPFPDDFLPPGAERGSLNTPDPGSHGEISRISLTIHQAWSARAQAKFKLDTIDKYDRNPTTDDNKIDIDEAWFLYGDFVAEDQAQSASGWYLKFGKMAKFERQNDRRSEGYGVLSTAFNRFEDAGIELGAQIGNHFYVKGSFTVGNPVFFRDTNALAGDNGTDAGNPANGANPQPELGSGFPIFYDADLEDYDFDEPETGIALGLKFGDVAAGNVVNLMAFAYNRDLRDTVDMTGSFYGGDLDLLNGVAEELGPAFAGGLPIEGRKKEEFGVNLWVYWGQFTAFAQYVDQEQASLPRDGFEIEAAYTIELPLLGAVAGKPILPWLRPAFRYSEITNDYAGNARIYPAPSVWWDWRKTDYALNALLYPGLLLTLEYSDNQFLLPVGWRNADETVISLGWKWNRGWGDHAAERN